MAWVRARFDGGHLVLADLTRKRPGVQVFQVIGPPTPDQVYPTASRIIGLGWWGSLLLRLALQARFNAGVEAWRDDTGLVLRLGAAADRIRSEHLRLLMQHEHRFHEPRLSYTQGKVTMLLRAKRQQDVAAFVGNRSLGLDVEVVDEHVDLTPWAGLEPAIPRRKALFWVRHPPPPGH